MTTTPASPPTDASMPTRACSYCRTEMGCGPGAECPDCGWEVGLVPISETRGPDGMVHTQFAVEQPVRYGRIALLMVVLAGTILFFSGFESTFWFVLLGLAVTTLGVYTWVQTRFAKIMYGLTPGKRIVCRTVLVLGTVLAFLTLIGIVIGFTYDK